MSDFDRRWKINTTVNPEDEFRKFKIRLMNDFKNIDSAMTKLGVYQYCMELAIDEVWQDPDRYDAFSEPISKNVSDSLDVENNIAEFFRKIEIIFRSEFSSDHIRGLYIKSLLRSLQLSRLEVDIKVLKKQVITVPKGEKFLDEEVDTTLSFLSGNSNKHLLDALKFYYEKNFIKSAESIRRSLEEFLRSQLGNKKGLKQNIVELGKLLKKDNRDAFIREIIMGTFSKLDYFFNNNSKHNDGDISEEENEFLIYQLASLMKYINEVTNQ